MFSSDLESAEALFELFCSAQLLCLVALLCLQGMKMRVWAWERQGDHVEVVGFCTILSSSICLITITVFVRIDKTHPRCSAGLAWLYSFSASCGGLLLLLQTWGWFMPCISIGSRSLISALQLGAEQDSCPISGAAGTDLHEPAPEILTAGLVASTKFSAHLFPYPCRSIPVKDHFSGPLHKHAQAMMLCKSCFVAIPAWEQEQCVFQAGFLPYAVMLLLPAVVP